MNKRSDDIALDTLRGLACLLLVLYHVIGSDPGSGLRIDDGPLRVLNDGLAYLRMPLFTVLSGIVYGMKPFSGDFRGFLRGKARRLLVPMLFVGTLFAVAQSAIPSTNFNAAGSDERSWLLLHVVPVGHFWFVEAMFWIFALVSLLEHRRLLATPRRLALVWLAAALLAVSGLGVRWFALDGAIYLFPYFLGGLAVTRFELAPRLAAPWTRAVLAAAAVLAIVQLGVPVPNPDRHSAWILVAGVALCGLAIGLPLRVRWLARIGLASYAIYLFHVFFMAAARIGLVATDLAPLPVQLLLGTACGIAGPMLVARLARRHDTLRLLLLGEAPRRTGGTKLGPVAAAR